MKAKDPQTRRQRLLRFLQGGRPAWKDADHPELANGAAAWVRTLRQESEKRALSTDKLEDNLEKQEPRVKAQIRKSSEEYRRGEKRDAGAFLTELRRKPSRPNTKRKTQT